VLALHLLVNAVEMLFPAADVADDAGLLERPLERFGDLADEFLLIAARALQFSFEHLVAVGIQCAEAEIFQLQFDGVQAQPFGDRCVNLQRFTRGAPPFDRRHGPQRAHVVHPVGEFHHDDADVAHHGQKHLAKAFGLGLLAVLELKLIELADPVDEFGHHLAEEGGDLRLRGGRVLDDVVQDRRHQGVGIKPQVGENVGHRDRMGDIGFAGNPLLSLMFFCAEFVGFADPLDLGRRQVGLEFV
jgi:hypothetical protein